MNGRHADLFFLFLGVLCIVNGLIAMVQGKVRMRGRLGRSRIYSGRQARNLSIFGIIVGIGFIIISFFYPF